MMIWARIIDQTIIGPFKADGGVKLNSDSYCDFIDKSRIFKMKCVFMHVNVPHISKLSRELFFFCIKYVQERR